MRIPAKFTPEKTCAYLFATVHVNGLAHKISLIIDTGSSVTTLSHWDATILGINTSTLRRRTEPSLTYAGRVRPFRLGGVDFIITEESGNLVLEYLEEVDILPSTGDKNLDEALPSVLGMDFLNECSYALCVCPKENEAFLEKC